MEKSPSPPLPTTEPQTKRAVTAYLAAGIMVFPALLAWVFTCIVIMPRLEKLWDMSGVQATRLRYLMMPLEKFSQGYWLLYPVVLGIIVVLEAKASFWPRWRARVLFAVVLIVNSIALLALADAAVIAAMLSPKVHSMK